MKNIFKWPKEIYIFWLVEFILGLELMGPILLIFFKDWGGLTQTEVQTLQSWFTLWIFILEIPTGVFGDIKGKKVSVLLGYIFIALGTFTYSLVPDIGLFMLSEFIFALGIALNSGAQEAWMYDTAKRLGLEKKFRDISVMGSNLHMLGMIVAAAIFPFVYARLPVHHIFRLGLIFPLISVILLGFFIKKTEKERDQNSLKPSYLQTAKEGWEGIRKSMDIKKISLYITILGTTSYFIIWLYQEALGVIGIPNEQFGNYRIVVLISQIVMIRVLGKVIERRGAKGTTQILAILVAVGFIAGAILQNYIGVVILLVLAGGIGLQTRTLFSKEINDEIKGEQRATILSFIGMIRRLALTIFNPMIGYLVDSKGVFIAFLILGIISLSASIFKIKK